MSDNIGSVSVEVTPDARGFPQKLKAQLKDLKVQVKVDLDDAGVKAKLKELGKNQKVKIDADLDSKGLGAKLRELVRPRTVVINADVKDQVAKARLDAITARERRLQIKADLDTKLAEARLAKLTRPRTVSVKADGVGATAAAVGGLTSNLGGLMGTAALLGPALIPATAAIAGLTGALAAPVAAAGLGAGIFGGVTIAALAKAKKDAKEIADLRKKATSATDATKAAAFTKQADQMFKDLGKSEQKFLEAQGTVKQAFDNLLKSRGVGKAVFGTLTGGAELLAKVLPKTAPLLRAFGGVIQGIEKDLGNFADSPKFKDFISYLTNQGTHAFSSLAKIAGHLTLGIASIFKAFTPMGQGLLDRFAKSMRGFDNIGQSSGFKAFLSYVKRVGPDVAATAGHIAQAVGKIITALMPQGSTMLGVIDALARSVAKMKPGQIAAVATAVGALGLATGKFSKLTSLSLLISGLSYAYKHSSAFKTLADDAGRLAAALNKIPSGGKLQLALAAGGAALALRGKGAGGGGGGIAGVAGKLLGSGVQKVFVTNPGFGGTGGLPGAPGKAAGKEAGTLKTAVTAAAASFWPVVLKLAPLGVAAAGINNEVKNPKQIAAREQGRGSALSKMSMGQLKTAYSLTLRGDAFNSKGVKLTVDQSVAQLKRLQAAMDRLKNGGASSGGPNLSKALDLSHFVDQAHKAGISTSQLGKLMHSLPKQVQTKVLSPGALTTRASIKALAKQYGLTPKQVKTLIKLTGARDAQHQTDQTRTRLGILNRTSAKPKIQPQGVDSANFGVNKVTRAVKTLGVQRAKPRVSLSDQASGPISAVRRMLDQLNGKHSKVYVTTYTNTQAGRAQGANNRATRANGGWVFGPGTSRSDSIPASLSNGEFVVNAAAAKQNAALLESINGAKAAVGQTKFATGGLVSGGGGSQHAITITNWDTGTGYMTTIADRSVNGRRAHDARLGRQSR